ncbi:DUF1320 domain-containing protein [Stenotrophomonas maltophilia]|uniref:gp436 family protein n=1 Tax=Stenotrophomonas maltophilia TaxID=40324 RepID=UPI0015DECA76|nr:DUF1320 domain-containing protein [Stenotrophomonas maltophilia]MBA0448674.1 DUF1320 domain-containing protein [Stenotrophomonas maltophilia]
MSYITLTQLAEIPGALELAQVATAKDQRPVSAALMDATLRGGDRSAFDPAEIVRADACVARIQEAIAQAGALIDGYLAKRYQLPLAQMDTMLPTWARSIVRYQLHGDRMSDERTDPIVRDYRDAMNFLRLIAKGDFHLGGADPTTGTTGLGDFLIHPGNKVFGRDGRP